MALMKCPECGCDISPHAFSCPHCGCNLVYLKAKPKFSRMLSNLKRYVIKARNIFIGLGIFFVIVMVVGFIVKESQTLKGDSKIAYDLIVESYYFHSAKDIVVISGMADENEVNGERKAYLTISYTDVSGNKIRGSYHITEHSVIDLQKAVNESKSGDDDYISNLFRLDLSKMDHSLDYEEITKALNSK